MIPVMIICISRLADTAQCYDCNEISHEYANECLTVYCNMNMQISKMVTVYYGLKSFILALQKRLIMYNYVQFLLLFH